MPPADRQPQKRRWTQRRYQSTRSDTSSHACSIRETGEGSPLDYQLIGRGFSYSALCAVGVKRSSCRVLETLRATAGKFLITERRANHLPFPLPERWGGAKGSKVSLIFSASTKS